MGICGSQYTHFSTGVTYTCLEKPGHEVEDGTMHHAETLCNGPVNW